MVGNVPARFTVTVQGSAAGGTGFLGGDNNVVNDGTINLTSIDGAQTAMFGPANSLTNNGTVNTIAGTGGSRTLLGHVVNTGKLSLQTGVVTLVITGTLTQSGAGANVTVEVDGNKPRHDVQVSGAANLGGTLRLVNGYSPAAGDTETVLTSTNVVGTFASVLGTNPPGPTVWNVNYGATSVTLNAA